MSKCDLSIELESGAVRYQPGDVVRGHVLVDVDAECTCKKLNVVLQWRTLGGPAIRDKGEPLKQTLLAGVYKWHLTNIGVRDRDKGEPLKQTLFEGVWRPGEQQGYPFEFTVPDGPLSYHGEILNVGWYINATADIPRAFDQKAEAEIFVHRGSYTGPLSVGNDRKHQQSQQRLSKSRGDLSNRMDLASWVHVGIAAVFLVPMFCMGIGVAIFGLLNVQKDPSAGNIFLLILGSVLILGPAIGLVFFLRWGKMKRKLGNVEVAVEATNTGIGMKIFCAITFTPQASVVLNRISADLVGQEFVYSFGGADGRWHIKEFHRESRELMSVQQLVPGNPVEEIVEFDLPADAPATFFARSNRLTWHVDVKVDVPSWPDYNDKVEITVLA